MYVFNVCVGVELDVINRHGGKIKSDENACGCVKGSAELKGYMINLKALSLKE